MIVVMIRSKHFYFEEVFCLEVKTLLLKHFLENI